MQDTIPARTTYDTIIKHTVLHCHIILYPAIPYHGRQHLTLPRGIPWVPIGLTFPDSIRDCSTGGWEAKLWTHSHKHIMSAANEKSRTGIRDPKLWIVMSTQAQDLHISSHQSKVVGSCKNPAFDIHTCFNNLDTSCQMP